MKGSHRFLLDNGIVVDSLPPEDEEKIKRHMAETFWKSFYKLVPKSIISGKVLEGNGIRDAPKYLQGTL